MGFTDCVFLQLALISFAHGLLFVSWVFCPACEFWGCFSVLVLVLSFSFRPLIVVVDGCCCMSLACRPCYAFVVFHICLDSVVGLV